MPDRKGFYEFYEDNCILYSTQAGGTVRNRTKKQTFHLMDDIIKIKVFLYQKPYLSAFWGFIQLINVRHKKSSFFIGIFHYCLNFDNLFASKGVKYMEFVLNIRIFYPFVHDVRLRMRTLLYFSCIEEKSLRFRRFIQFTVYKIDTVHESCYTGCNNYNLFGKEGETHENGKNTDGNNRNFACGPICRRAEICPIRGTAKLQKQGAVCKCLQAVEMRFFKENAIQGSLHSRMHSTVLTAESHALQS